MKTLEGNHVGDLVTWGFAGRDRQEDVRQAFENVGLADEIKLPRITAISAYRRAVRESVRGHKRDEAKWDVVKLSDSREVILHAIVRRDVVLSALRSGQIKRDAGDGEFFAGEADFRQEGRIGFDKAAYFAGAQPEALIKLEVPEHAVSQKFLSSYEENVVVFQHKDVRRAFQRAFVRWGGARVTAAGGLWYIPAGSSELIQSWAAAMHELQNEAVVLPQIDAGDTLLALREAAQDNLEAQIAKIEEDLQKFVGKKKVRASSYQRRVDRFDEMRAAVELQQDALSFKMRDLGEKLEKARRHLVEVTITD